MLFARRNPPGLGERLSVLLWPRRSWRRSGRYVTLRLMRQAAAPDLLARGVAMGLFAATLPIFGLQMLLALALALLVRGHVPAALLATFWANPVTIPVLLGLSYWTGAQLLGLDAVQIAQDFQQMRQMQVPLSGTLWDSLRVFHDRVAPVFAPLLIGALPLAISVASFGYVAVYLVMSQMRRKGPIMSDLGMLTETRRWVPLESFEGGRSHHSGD